MTDPKVLLEQETRREKSKDILAEAMGVTRAQLDRKLQYQCDTASVSAWTALDAIGAALRQMKAESAGLPGLSHQIQEEIVMTGEMERLVEALRDHAPLDTLGDEHRPMQRDQVRAILLSLCAGLSDEVTEAGEQAWMNRDLSDQDSSPLRDAFRAMLTKIAEQPS